MSIQPDELAKRVLRREWHHLTADERRVVESILHRVATVRDATVIAEQQATFGDRLADRIAAFGGSWTFMIMFTAFLIGWTVLNTKILGPRREAFDPYPYVFLNLFLSMLAAAQAPIILMSQNRQAARDRIDVQNDYRVNLNAEMQIQAMHAKIDELREHRWQELIDLQREQIRLLTAAAATRPANETEG